MVPVFLFYFLPAVRGLVVQFVMNTLAILYVEFL